MSPSVRPLWRGLLSPVFVVSVLIAIAAAVGLRPGMIALADYYRKEPVELRRSLTQFDVSALQSFRRLPESRALTVPLEAIGTDEYTVLFLEKKGSVDPARREALFVTYYSDPDDRVPHTPEVCWRQGETIVKDVSAITLDTPELAPEHPQIPARLLRMEQPSDHVVLVYVFCANGRFYDSRERVRLAVAWPGARHVYFSKIEAVAYYPRKADPGPSLARCKQLLREALPILVQQHYPTKEDLERR